MDMIENRPFDEIKPGDTASLVRRLRREDIALFAIMSGDVNPAHVEMPQLPLSSRSAQHQQTRLCYT